MMNYYFSTDLEHGRRLYLAPLSDKRLTACADEIDDASGYFLFEETIRGSTSEIEILARVHCDEAALRLRSLFNME